MYLDMSTKKVNIVKLIKCTTNSRRPIIYPSGKIIAHDKRYIKGNYNQNF